MLETVRLGKTELKVTRIAMGCIPIQRLDEAEAVALLRRARDEGVNFFDTAHVYTDSEDKLGKAFPGAARREVVLATKAMADTYEETTRQLETSLRRLGTDYIDIYQWHNAEDIEGFQNRRGPYQAMLDAQKAGKVLHLGFTNHNPGRARAAVESGAFATLQFPMSVLATPEELDVSFLCRDRDMGFIAMKAMCGGLLDDGRLPFAFLNQYPHIVPIWGIEKTAELEQFLGLARNPEPFSDAMRAEVERLRAEYGDAYCRGCGYCLPCPANIDIPTLMRIVLFIKRQALGSQFTPKRRAEMDNIDNCVQCRACADRCPYHLDVPTMLAGQQTEYRRLDAAYSEGLN